MEQKTKQMSYYTNDLSCLYDNFVGIIYPESIWYGKPSFLSWNKTWDPSSLKTAKILKKLLKLFA